VVTKEDPYFENEDCHPYKSACKSFLLNYYQILQFYNFQFYNFTILQSYKCSPLASSPCSTITSPYQHTQEYCHTHNKIIIVADVLIVPFRYCLFPNTPFCCHIHSDLLLFPCVLLCIFQTYPTLTLGICGVRGNSHVAFVSKPLSLHQSIVRLSWQLQTKGFPGKTSTLLN
jgi:hypothetical protein